ncbi:MAG: type I-E CRISPR-associated protein Cas5/CasD [Psychrosphaera sp.]|nr:type I-E CRISPR-associated protein Cas5/CasD [Psychrosphaera sp.]
MHDYLIFQLYGAMASWGDIAVGEARHTALYPSKSALTGLIAAALGIKRDEEQRQLQLTKSLQFGIKVLSSGSILRDYHTSQVPPQERKRVFHTREQELKHAAKLNTILSTRDYRADAYALVAVSVTQDAPYSLQQISDALKTPKFVLYLGRKSCPLAVPLDAQLAEQTKGLQAAFDLYDRKSLCCIGKADNWLPTCKPFYVWEGNAFDLTPEQSKVRHDLPISRKRWQFAQRQEHISYGGGE